MFCPPARFFSSPKLVLGTYDHKILRANNLHQAILAYLGCKDNCRLSNRGHFFLLNRLDASVSWAIDTEGIAHG